MTTKKRLRDVPVLHDQVKERHQIVVTPTAWENMKREASRRKISVSELIEEFGRGINSSAGLSP
ncbi:hypothetical protein [Scytonema sp. PCC 10023]|uniref:hypothetical protein n=1 Tax=Scytonema sp. PCC 10023 TaxID=1680591 RepID=UPI0039C67518